MVCLVQCLNVIDKQVKVYFTYLYLGGHVLAPESQISFDPTLNKIFTQLKSVNLLINEVLQSREDGAEPGSKQAKKP